jgi:galactokinase
VVKYETMLELQIIDLFKTKFRTHGRLFSSPGRINVIGEHTDYNQGFVLPTIIKQQFYVVIAKRGGLDPFPIIRISSPQYNDFIEFNLFTPPQKQWARYFYGVIKEFQKRGKEITSIDVMIHSDIPVGAGLSSSAALCSAFAKALNGLFNFDLKLIDLAYIGQAVEHNYIGVKCGLMDQFASIFGRKDTLIKLDCKTFEYEYILFQHPEIKMVLFNSRVKHTLASSEYNLRRQSCENVVALLQLQNPEIQSLRDVSSDLLMENEKSIDKIDYKRAKFILEENYRVINLSYDLKRDDLSSLHYLIFASHEGLRDQYEVSCKELDFLVESAEKCTGIIGARMMGGGFGGCTINFVEADHYDAFMTEMCAFFEKKYHKTAVYYEV